MDFADFMIKGHENEKAKIEYLNKVYDKVNEAVDKINERLISEFDEKKLPQNLEIRLPFHECENCDRCKPYVAQDSKKMAMQAMTQYVPGRFSPIYYILGCENMLGCERLVNKIGRLELSIAESKLGNAELVEDENELT